MQSPDWNAENGRASTGSIFHASLSCRRHLEACVALPAVVADEDFFRMRLADFNLWASGSGALANARLSLDARLAEEPNVHAVILNLLCLLGSLLEKCQHQQDGSTFPNDRIAKPSRTLSGSQASGQEETDSQSLLDALDRIKRLITHLVRISTAIRRSGTRARLEQADSEFEKDRHDELKRFLTILVAGKAFGMRYEEAKLDPIIDRLIHANLRRRHRFLYSWRRATKQAPSDQEVENQQKLVPGPGKVEKSAKPELRLGASSSRNVDTQRPATTLSLIASSAATPLKEPVEMPSGSQASHIAATSTTSKVIYPRAPKVAADQETFRCPCCWQTLPVASSKGSPWKRHLSEDIMPYTCVLENCPDPETLYLTRKEWTKHMEDHGTSKYWLCTACLEPIKFENEDHFLQHLRAQHGEGISSDEFSSIADICSYTVIRGFSSCPLCLPGTGFNSERDEGQEFDRAAVLNHVAEHLHTFSLYSLPWPNPGDGELQYLGLTQKEVLDKVQGSYFAGTLEESDAGSINPTESSLESDDRAEGLPEPIFEDTRPRDEIVSSPEPVPPNIESSSRGAAPPDTVSESSAQGSLYRQLFDSRLSDDLHHRKYIPNNELRKILARDNIISELNEHHKRWSLKRIRQNSTNLANRILESGQRLFVILVNLSLSWGVKNLLDAGLTDKDLPLSKRGNHLSSPVDPARSFKWPSEWGLEKLDDFVEKQWLVLAPVFATRGAHRALAPECPLPFVTVVEAQHGPRNVVYKVLVNSSHQEGFKAETPSLEVALKEFKFKEDFEKERDNLNIIRGLSLNKHIIQNLETFSQGNKTYIMFPWAEGGDLDNFWKDKNTEARSPQLALWCLKQMLGLAEALEFLHNRIGEQANFRHGDLKPGNILHFLTGGPYGILKIADFGTPRIHDVKTLQRGGIATTTRATTPSYQAPEAIYTDRPRSRKFDIWSLGCIFVEFTIWFVRDWEAVEKFSSARKPTAVEQDKAHFYQMKHTKAEYGTEVHPAVVDNIASLKTVAHSDKDTAFVEVLEIIEIHLLRIEVEDRVDAKTLRELLAGVLKRAQGDQV